MNYKRLFLAAFYVILSFAFTKDVTAFDKAGVTQLNSASGDTPNPNWDMKGN